jgi:hypothetical protein
MNRRDLLIGLLAVPAGVGMTGLVACSRKPDPVHVTYYYLPG